MIEESYYRGRPNKAIIREEGKVTRLDSRAKKQKRLDVAPLSIRRNRLLTSHPN